MRQPRRLLIAVPNMIAIIALITFGFSLGTLSNLSTRVDAEIRKPPPRKSFLAGSERSEVYLKEIAGTLKRMESRLEKIERKVQSLPKK